MTEATAPTREQILDEELTSVQRSVDDDWRHGSSISEVFRRESDVSYWRVSFRVSTDGEYHGIREDDYDISQVFPVQVTTTQYKTTEEAG